MNIFCINKDYASLEYSLIIVFLGLSLYAEKKKKEE